MKKLYIVKLSGEMIVYAKNNEEASEIALTHRSNEPNSSFKTIVTEVKFFDDLDKEQLESLPWKKPLYDEDQRTCEQILMEKYRVIGSGKMTCCDFHKNGGYEIAQCILDEYEKLYQSILLK